MAGARRWPGRLVLWAAVVLIGVATFFLRAVHLDRSWDIFVDEISYLRLSQSVADNLEVKLYGNPFYLHPPLYFFLEGIYIKLLPPTGDLIHQIYDVRYLNVALAGLTAVVLFGIGRCLGGWPVGAATAAIFALEPFIIKMNSRNYLDTSAMLWVVLGYFVLFSAITDEKGRLLVLLRVLAAGVLFGLALLTKDITAFATLLPLAVCFFMNWAMPRLQSALIGVVAVLVYMPYPISVYVGGDWRDFSYQKLQGASRLAGLLHETGFNQEGGPSFLEVIIKNLDEFATTYALLATGGLSVVILFFFFGGAAERLLLTWTASTYALLAYIVVLGTLEEQFFYYLIISSILSTVLTAKLILGTEAFGDHVRRALLAATVLLAVAFFSWTGYIWSQIHYIPDNGYERIVAYVEHNVPKDSKIAVIPDTGEFLIKGSSGKYGSVEELQKNDVDYVVYGSYVLEEGYGKASPEFYRWITDNGELVYGFEGRSFGLLGVYRLPDRYTGSGLEQEAPTTTVGETTKGPALSPATSQEANELGVTVRVVGAPAWLRVQEDGRTVLDQESPPGFSRRFEAGQEVKIGTANAGAIRVEADGRDVGTLGASGEVGNWRVFRASSER